MYGDLYLAHYGVKGMKWGVRRTPEQLGHKSLKKLDKAIKKQLKSNRKHLNAIDRVVDHSYDVVQSPKKRREIFANAQPVGQKPKTPKQIKSAWDKGTRLDNQHYRMNHGKAKDDNDWENFTRRYNKEMGDVQYVFNQERKKGTYYNTWSDVLEPSWSIDRKTNKVTYASAATTAWAKCAGIDVDSYVHIEDRMLDMYDRRLR